MLFIQQYSGQWMFVLMALIEMCALLAFYRLDRVCADVRMMTGTRPLKMLLAIPLYTGAPVFLLVRAPRPLRLLCRRCSSHR
jgi:hypothetical protein